MATYKTPGVYVEEISTLPASVAQVETAIPAFIGYTQKHRDNDGSNLLDVPTRISSLVEYREIFGGAPPLTVTDVKLDGSYNVTEVNMNDTFYLYDSLRLFYSNGGGDCYIVSVGTYTDPIATGEIDESAAGFLKGVNRLKKADEPTLLLVPDAVSLGSKSLLAKVQKGVLMHCANMQDRFGVLDLENKADLSDAVNDFREGIGVNDLKYGAAYAPWLKATLTRDVRYADVKDKLYKGGVQVVLRNLADPTSNEAKFTADRLDNLVTDDAQVKTSTDALLAGATNLQERFDTLFEGFKNEAVSATKKTKLQTLFNFYWSVIHLADDWLYQAGAADFQDRKASAAYGGYSATLKAGKTYTYDASSTFVTDNYKAVAANIHKHEQLAFDAVAMALQVANGRTWQQDGTEWGGIFTVPLNKPDKTTITDPWPAAGTNLLKMEGATSAIGALWTDIYSGVQAVSDIVSNALRAVEDAAKQQIPVLKSVIGYIAAQLVILPPSGAMVGIYAATDRNRGVWKAPANVSLNSVAGLTHLISNESQAMMNVDAVAGKSVNAIRSFTGRGILVWGARTLAGNDNEWRYVPVRRLYLMVEESVKKATEFVVFEPNDANTWVRVKGMISNFLTELWKQGALAGSKADQAFFVNVGLGSTMTPQDILEGRMIVEIGMAAVRPAEFIILRFYHKLQEA